MVNMKQNKINFSILVMQPLLVYSSNKYLHRNKYNSDSLSDMVIFHAFKLQVG